MAETSDTAYIHTFNDYLAGLLKNAARIVKDDVRMAPFVLSMIKQQRSSVKIRNRWEKKGTHVPPFLIVSITSRCNLRCHGCYATGWKDIEEEEMDIGLIDRLFSEASDLGVSFVLLAGGEPLIRRDILELASKYPKIIFPVFTNGMLIDDEAIKLFKKAKNIIPVISLEGRQELTDKRRGEGTFTHLRDIAEKLKKAGVFFGTSLTVTNLNMDMITSDEYVDEVLGMGFKLMFFVEYVPVKEGTEGLVPTQKQRERLIRRTQELRDERAGLFVAFPGDEDKFGGCLSSGRGFLHINPYGYIEPCPFAPYHDSSLRDVPLHEAMNSRLLKAIRSNREMLSEVNGGCALWTHRDWVKSILEAQ